MTVLMMAFILPMSILPALGKEMYIIQVFASGPANAREKVWLKFNGDLIPVTKFAGKGSAKHNKTHKWIHFYHVKTNVPADYVCVGTQSACTKVTGTGRVRKAKFY